MNPLQNINDWFRNLNLRQKLTVHTVIMSIFLIINGLIGFYIGYIRIFPQFGVLVILGISVLVLSLTIPLILLITKTIGNPIRLLVEKMKQVAAGNLDVEPQETRYKNEVGDLNQSFNTMTERLRCLITKERNTREKEHQLREREEFLRHIVISSITSFDLKEVIRTTVVDTGKLYDAIRCHFVQYNNDSKEFLPVEDYQSYVADIKHKTIIGHNITTDIFQPFLKMLIGQKLPVAVGDITTQMVLQKFFIWFCKFNDTENLRKSKI